MTTCHMVKPLLLITILSFLLTHPGFSQDLTFGDLIPDLYLPSKISPSTPLNCDRYFQLVDSINLRIFKLRGMNPLPEYRCGNDTLSHLAPSLEAAAREIAYGSILVRMIIDRMGRPVCCKVYVKEGGDPGKEVVSAFSRLKFTPVYLKGKAVASECRYIYDFSLPKLSGKKIIE